MSSFILFLETSIRIALVCGSEARDFLRPRIGIEEEQFKHPRRIFLSTAKRVVGERKYEGGGVRKADWVSRRVSQGFEEVG
jgi:hypothetical protein